MTPRQRYLLVAAISIGIIGLGYLLGSVQPHTAALVGTTITLIAIGILVLGHRGVNGLVQAFAILTCLTIAWNGVRIHPSIALSDAFLLMAALLVIPRLISAQGWQIVSSVAPLLRVSLLITVGGFAATTLNPETESGLLNLLRFSLAALVLPMVFALALHRTDINLLQLAFILSVMVSVLVAAAFEDVPYSGRMQGLSNHPNHLGLTAVLAFGLAAYRCTQAGVRQLALVWIPATLLLLYGIVLSESRAALVGTLGVLAMLTLCSRHNRVLIVATASLLGGTVLAWALLDVGGGLFEKTNRIFDLGSEQVINSNLERQAQLADAWQSIMQNPFLGQGFANAREAHNVVLQLWIAGGLLGLAGLALLLVETLWKPLKLLTSSSQTRSIEIIGPMSGFFGFFIADVFQNALWERFFWLFPTLIVASCYKIRPFRCEMQESLLNKRGRQYVAGKVTGLSS